MSDIVTTPAATRRLSLRPMSVPAAVIGSVSLGTAQVLVAVLFAAASLLLVRSLPTEEFGRVAFGLNAHLLLLTLFGFGLSTGVMAETVDARTRAAAVTNVRTLFELRLLTLAPLLLAAVLWALIADDDIPILAGVAASLYVVQDFLVGILSGQLRARLAAVVIIVQPITYLALLLGLGAHGAERVLLSLIGAIFASLVLAAALAVPAGGRKPTLTALSLAPLRRALGLAGYAYVLTLVNIGFMVLPVLALGTLGRYTEAATLSIVLTLARFVPESFSLVTAAVYFPRLKAMPVMGPMAVGFFRTFGKLLALGAIPAAVALVVVGEPVLSILFDGRYDYLATDLTIASLIVLILPFDALVSWTLLASGAGRVAVIAAVTRLTIILAACLGLVSAVPTGALPLIVTAYPVALSASLLIGAVGLRRRWQAVVASRQVPT